MDTSLDRAILRSNYFADMYRRQKDIRKLQYYEKRLRQLERELIYLNVGGEREYYKNYYKKFIKEFNNQ